MYPIIKYDLHASILCADFRPPQFVYQFSTCKIHSPHHSPSADSSIPPSTQFIAGTSSGNIFRFDEEEDQSVCVARFALLYFSLFHQHLSSDLDGTFVNLFYYPDKDSIVVFTGNRNMYVIDLASTSTDVTPSHVCPSYSSPKSSFLFLCSPR